MRTRQKYTNHTFVNTSMGVKIFATGLEKVIAGTALRIACDDKDLETVEAEVQAEVDSICVGFAREEVGVFVKAGELGKLEALLSMALSKRIPVFEVGVGEVQQKDVKRTAVMREKGAGDFAVIFAFDTQIGPATLDQAKRDGVQVVASKSIFELEARLDQFEKALKDKAKKDAARHVTFPVTLRVLRDFKKDPVILGCEITCGQLRVGTPLCVDVGGVTTMLGQVTGIQKNGESTLTARAGDQVGVEVAQTVEQGRIKYGKGKALYRDVILFSQITRQGLDALRQHFNEEMLTEDWRLLETLARCCGIHEGFHAA